MYTTRKKFAVSMIGALMLAILIGYTLGLVTSGKREVAEESTVFDEAQKQGAWDNDTVSDVEPATLELTAHLFTLSDRWVEDMATFINNGVLENRHLVTFNTILSRRESWVRDLRRLKGLIIADDLEAVAGVVTRHILRQPAGVQVELFREFLPNTRQALAREIMLFETLEREGSFLLKVEQLRDLGKSSPVSISFEWVKGRLLRESLSDIEQRVLNGVLVELEVESIVGLSGSFIEWSAIAEDIQWEHANMGLRGSRNWNVLIGELERAETWQEMRRVLRLMRRHHAGRFIVDERIDVYSFNTAAELELVRNDVLGR